MPKDQLLESLSTVTDFLEQELANADYITSFDDPEITISSMCNVCGTTEHAAHLSTCRYRKIREAIKQARSYLGHPTG